MLSGIAGACSLYKSNKISRSKEAAGSCQSLFRTTYQTEYPIIQSITQFNENRGGKSDTGATNKAKRCCQNIGADFAA
jgi:hypothetical protein